MDPERSRALLDTLSGQAVDATAVPHDLPGVQGGPQLLGSGDLEDLGAPCRATVLRHDQGDEGHRPSVAQTPPCRCRDIHRPQGTSSSLPVVSRPSSAS